MSRWWPALKQALYPPEFQISPMEGESDLAAAMLRLIATVEALPRTAETPPAEAKKDAGTPPPAPDGLEKAFVIDLCNQIHRLNRGLKKAQENGNPEAGGLKAHVDRLAKTLANHSVQCEDPSGQIWDPGRVDFEPLGEPQIVPGLTQLTILQCERPVVRLGGKVIQSAKGAVGAPPA
jgi:hypothetical protein